MVCIKVNISLSFCCLATKGEKKIYENTFIVNLTALKSHKCVQLVGEKQNRCKQLTESQLSSAALMHIKQQMMGE